MLTRAERTLAFEHIIRILFDQQGDTPLVLALQQNGILDPTTSHHQLTPQGYPPLAV